VNKTGLRSSQVAIMVAFALSCFGLLLFLWLAFGGPIPLKPKGYRINASFSEATTLAIEADVRISGVRVGKVKTIEPNRTSGRSDVVIELESKYAPLPQDAKATLRQKTLLGETYVELTPGTKDGPAIPEGGHLAQSDIADSVQLDEIFRTFDPKTREAFQVWMQEQATAIKGHGADLNAAFGNLGPFAEDASELVAILKRQDSALRRLISNSGVVFGALSERDGQLRSMVSHLDTVFRTTGSRDTQLEEAFTALPTFQRESRATLQRLDRFAANANPLVTQLRPAARELSPTLTHLNALAPDLKAVFRDLRPLIRASATGFPATQRLLDDLRPFLDQVHPTMQQVIPILQFIAPYKREITAFFANTVAATQATDIIPGTTRKVHYLRTTNPVSPEMLAAYPRRIGSNRPNPYLHPGAFDQLAGGLPVFEDRHCGRGVPVVSQVADPLLEQVIPPALHDQINTFLYPVTSNGQVPAPPCNKQGPYAFQGETSMYPHVKPAP
jgi:phospholipid/cholesterol/gamma-HCH transport system substrate-binding protein